MTLLPYPRPITDIIFFLRKQLGHTARPLFLSSCFVCTSMRPSSVNPCADSCTPARSATSYSSVTRLAYKHTYLEKKTQHINRCLYNWSIHRALADEDHPDRRGLKKSYRMYGHLRTHMNRTVYVDPKSPPLLSSSLDRMDCLAPLAKRGWRL